MDTHELGFAIAAGCVSIFLDDIFYVCWAAYKKRKYPHRHPRQNVLPALPPAVTGDLEETE